MKNIISSAGFVGLSLLISSCDLSLPSNDSHGDGTISIAFSGQSEFHHTKGSGQIPDTNQFLLTVKSSSGEVVYDGRFGDSPQKLPVKEGSYTVYARSMDFSEPLFDSPQYADEQSVTVKASENSCVNLVCSQSNCGIRLLVDSKFRTDYPDGVLYLKSSEGKLMYGYNEKRIAYFNPGMVALSLVEAEEERTLLTRRLNSREILSLSISSTGTGTEQGGISIAVDTARIWNSDSFCDGQSAPGQSVESALSIAEAKCSIGSKGVWVYGFIVGTSTSSSKSEFTTPFTIATNLVLSSRTSVTDRSECLSLELSKGDPRDCLNLKDNPGNLGKQVFVKGDIEERYYGLPGIKNVSEYLLKQ